LKIFSNLTRANGTAEREASQTMLKAALRQIGVTPHVAPGRQKTAKRFIFRSFSADC
jgi:hypothetical protein